MPSKLALHQFLWVVLLVFITACGTGVPVQTATATTTRTLEPTVLPTGTPFPTSLPTFTALFPSLTPFSTFTSAPPTATPLVNSTVIHAWQTEVAIATPIRTAVGPETVVKLPRAYARDGNLYFQDSMGKTVQLTNSGEDRDPILSDDEQKIVFYRGENEDNIYAINPDGSAAQLIITSQSLPLRGQGDIKAPTFVPGTHHVLFNTYLCDPGPDGPSYNAPDCTVGVYRIDTDIMEITEIVTELSGNTMQDHNFEVSPNGQYISIAASGQIDVYAGNDIVYPEAITYHITDPDEYLPKQYWLPDSSGLIAIAAADNESNEPGTRPASYTAYRYILGSQEEQILLDKFITWDGGGDYWCVSPDRKWVLFAGNDSGNRGDTGLYYLGNLTNGRTQAYLSPDWPLYFCKWSPDSRHFALANTIGFIGSVDGPPIPVAGYFVEWIDDTHYYYGVIGGATDPIKTYIGEIRDH